MAQRARSIEFSVQNDQVHVIGQADVALAETRGMTGLRTQARVSSTSFAHARAQ